MRKNSKSAVSVWGLFLGAWVLATRVVIASVLIVAAVSKVERQYDFLRVVYDYQILGQYQGLLIAKVLPWLELSLGVFILTGCFLEISLWGASAMLAAFGFAKFSVILRGIDTSCGCFGSWEQSEVTQGDVILTFSAALVAVLSSVYLRATSAKPGDVIESRVVD